MLRKKRRRNKRISTVRPDGIILPRLATVIMSMRVRQRQPIVFFGLSTGCRWKIISPEHARRSRSSSTGASSCGDNPWGGGRGYRCVAKTNTPTAKNRSTESVEHVDLHIGRSPDTRSPIKYVPISPRLSPAAFDYRLFGNVFDVRMLKVHRSPHRVFDCISNMGSICLNQTNGRFFMFYRYGMQHTTCQWRTLEFFMEGEG